MEIAVSRSILRCRGSLGSQSRYFIGGSFCVLVVQIFGVDPALEPPMKLDPVPCGAPADLLGGPAP